MPSEQRRTDAINIGTAQMGAVQGRDGTAEAKSILEG
jgi:hypothetical protein